MTKKEKMEVLNEKAAAYYSGFGGIEIKRIEYGINDYVIYVSGAWNGTRAAHRVRINYAENPYFLHNGIRIHLNKCLRVY